MTYGLVADIHCHNWSSFSEVTPEGINTRLAAILGELQRAGLAVKSAGGDTLIIAGDLFHVRGRVQPSVLNPVMEALRGLSSMGVYVYILAGNHDLEGKTSEWLGSAVSSLESINGVEVINEAKGFVFPDDNRVFVIPWIEDIEELKRQILTCNPTGGTYRDTDLILHAPINGVIKGLPETGLDPAWLETLNFRNIFAGHYHNHKKMGDNVWSIGAIAHHTWNDVGSKAGFLLVNGKDVLYQASSCPRFVELTSEMSETDMALEADGNYVRIKVSASLEEVNAMRETLKAAGAKGVTVINEPARKTASRVATSIKSGMTLDESVQRYIDPTGADPALNDMKAYCQDLLDQVRAL